MKDKFIDELSDDALECAESDRKYKQKEQSNQVIFNEGKYNNNNFITK